MDQCNVVADKLCFWDNQSLQHIQVCMQHMDPQSNQGYIDKLQLCFSHCTLHLIHMEMDYKGLFYQLQE